MDQINIDQVRCRNIGNDLLKAYEQGYADGFNRGCCKFEPVDFLDELACSACGKVIGIRADTNAMKYCPYCGRERVDDE